MATYVAVTDWTPAAKGTNTGQSTWLGAAARIVKDADASTSTSFVLYAEYSFYLWELKPNASPTINIYKFVSDVDTGSLFSSTSQPNRMEPIDIRSGTVPGIKGTVRRVSIGTFGNNVNVSTKAFQTGCSVDSGTSKSNYAVATYTTPSAEPVAGSYVNKVVLGTETLIDISDDTVTPSVMLSGYTAHDQDGSPIQGTIESKSSSNMTRNGAVVTAPAGYYASDGVYTVPSGSAVTPTGITITTTPSLNFNATSGNVEASFSGSTLVTPNTTAGYVSTGTGTGNTVNASGSVSKTPVQLDPNIIADNIRSKTDSGTSISILGIQGTFTSDANANVGDVLNTKTFYKDGKKYTGTMANNNNQNVVITNLTGTSLSGYYGGTSKAKIDDTSAANIRPENIAEGITILGVTGELSADDIIDIQEVKTVNSKFTQASYTADSPHNYMANVVVRPIQVTRVTTVNSSNHTTDGYTVTISEYSGS